MRDKQIEEMARTMCFQRKNCTVKSCIELNCEKTWLAEALYNAGYRKASDVALEILNEVDDILWKYKRSGVSINVSHIHLDIAELKKKYESEEK